MFFAVVWSVARQKDPFLLLPKVSLSVCSWFTRQFIPPITFHLSRWSSYTSLLCLQILCSSMVNLLSGGTTSCGNLDEAKSWIGMSICCSFLGMVVIVNLSDTVIKTYFSHSPGSSDSFGPKKGCTIFNSYTWPQMTIPVEKVEEKEGVIDVVSMIRPPRLIGFGWLHRLLHPKIQIR